jgi:hypothetical protein
MLKLRATWYYLGHIKNRRIGTLIPYKKVLRNFLSEFFQLTFLKINLTENLLL